MSEKDEKKNIFFFKKLIILKCSYGHVKWSFDNPAENFRKNAEKFLLKVRERSEKD